MRENLAWVVPNLPPQDPACSEHLGFHRLGQDARRQISWRRSELFYVCSRPEADVRMGVSREPELRQLAWTNAVSEIRQNAQLGLLPARVYLVELLENVCVIETLLGTFRIVWVERADDSELRLIL